MAKTGYIITVYQDINPSSPTYNQLKEEKVQDETNCPVTPPTPDPIDYSSQYLIIEAIEDGTFTFTGTSSNSLSYSLDDGQTWTALASGTASPTVTAGNKIMWKGITTPNRYGIGKFSSTGRFNTYGNIMSIVYGDNFEGQTVIGNFQFYSLFDNSKVVSAKNLVLPATTLAQECYLQMFQGCTNLTSAPELPATTLAQECYAEMFIDCTSLVNAPALPSTTLAEACYVSMFYGCRNLTSAPALPSTTLADYCYDSMFSRCSSLVTAPQLPATTLREGCYQSMFNGCTNLNNIKCLATDITASYCTPNWVDGVAASGTFTKASSMTDWTTGTNGIPSGWTVINE